MATSQPGDPGYSSSSDTMSSATAAGMAATGQLVPVSVAGVPAMPISFGEGFSMRPEILQAKPDPISILKALRRNWLLALILGFSSGGALFALAWMFIPLYYDIEAQIRVGWTEDSVNLTNRRPMDTKALESFVKTQPFLVKSQRVLDAALRDPAVSQSRLLVHEPNKRDWLRENLIVGYLGDSDVMEIKMRNEYPSELVTIVNAVQSAYLREVVSQDKDEKNRRLERMREEMRQRTAAIAELETRINTLSSRIGVYSEEEAGARERILTSRLSSLEHQRTQLERDQIENATKVTSLIVARQLANDDRLTDMAIREALMEDPEIRELETRLRAYKRLLAETQSMVTRDDAPALQGIRREIYRYQEQLEKAKKDVVPFLMESYKAKTLVEIEAELGVVLKVKEVIEEKLDKVGEEIARLEKELDSVRKFDAEIAQLRTQLTPMKEMASKLQEEVAGLEIDSRLQDRIKLLSPATMPEGRDRTTWLILVTFFGVVGFSLAVAGLGLQQFFQRRVESAAQVSQGLGLRVIGTLPEMAAAASKGGAVQAASQAQLADSIDAIRTRLTCGNPDRRRQVILVTSSVEQEGKSTVASQLAASLARGGRKTVLVDADLRRPAIHELFGLDLGAGLSELLRGDAKLDETLHATSSDALAVITAGQWDARSIQALSSDAAKDLMQELRNRFDFVILDSCPILACSDSLHLGQFVDAALLALRKDRSRLNHVYESYERIRAVNIELLGAVVNGESPHAGRRAQQLHVPVQV